MKRTNRPIGALTYDGPTNYDSIHFEGFSTAAETQRHGGNTHNYTATPIVAWGAIDHFR